MLLTEVTTLDDFPDGDVVVLFTAPSWCIPCQRLHPHLEKVSDTLNDVTFLKVDLDGENGPKLAGDYGVMGVPTLLHFRNGKRLTDLKGRTGPALLKELS